MANKTLNYNLNKPTENEYVDINVLNENMDIIDEELYKKANSVDVPTDEHIKTIINENVPTSGRVHVDTSAPSDTTMAWVDTGNGGILKYYNGTEWTVVKAVWG